MSTKIKKMPKKKPETKKAKPRKKVSAIDKAFKDKDFKFLAGNSLVYENNNEELIILLENMWSSIKRANENAKDYSFSIIILFSTVAEMFLLQRDRKTRLKSKREIYQERIDNCKSNIVEMQEIRQLKEEVIKDLKNGSNINQLTPTQRIKVRKVEAEIAEVNIRIREEYSKLKAARYSKDLIMYEVGTNGQVFNDATTHLLSKNEKVIKLLKEFNLTPNLAPLITGNKKIKQMDIVHDDALSQLKGFEKIND